MENLKSENTFHLTHIEHSHYAVHKFLAGIVSCFSFLFRVKHLCYNILIHTKEIYDARYSGSRQQWVSGWLGRVYFSNESDFGIFKSMCICYCWPFCVVLISIVPFLPYSPWAFCLSNGLKTNILRLLPKQLPACKHHHQPRNIDSFFIFHEKHSKIKLNE